MQNFNAEKPLRVEGHYCLALNLVGMAEMSEATRRLRLLRSYPKNLKFRPGK
jgi:hypothetical protein